MTDEDRIAAATQRYKRATHAMQSGVAQSLSMGVEAAKDCEPKHLRVGINAAMADAGALVKLLVDKGVITRVEYLEALAEGMEREKVSYEVTLSERLGAKVTLA